MLDREQVIKQAYEDCMTEMYAKSQPPADYKKLVDGVKNGEIEDSPGNELYKRHYLSEEEFKYILNKYKKAYRIEEEFTSNVELVEQQFNGEGRKDVWVPEEETEGGFKRPGYRTSEQVKPFKNAINHLVNDEVANEIHNIALNYIKDCKDFYRFDREDSSFSFSVALGCSPISNKDIVIEYWKNKGIDINIKDKNPLLLWDEDYYGDEFEEVMKDEYGENWEEYWWNEYYNSNQGKEKIVYEFLSKNRDKYNYHYVSTDDNDELFISSFKDNNVHIPIDVFINDNNLKQN